MAHLYRVSYVFGDITVATTNEDRVVFPDSGINQGRRDPWADLRSRVVAVEQLDQTLDGLAVT